MAGVALEYSAADLKATARAAAAALAKAGDGARLLDEIGAYLELSVSERFRQEVGPDNVPWQPTRRGHSILKGSPPQLMSSITRRTGPDSVEIGTNKIYAAIHQKGGTIRPKSAPFLVFTAADGATVFAREVTIPARPFLGIDDADNAAIEQIVHDFHGRAFR